MKKKRSIVPVFIVLIVGLAVLAFFQVPRHTKSDVAKTITEDLIEMSVEYEVRSNRDTLLWSSGEVMEQGLPLYFFSLNPDLTLYPTLEAAKTYTGTVDLEAYLENAERDGSTYWSKDIESRQYDISLNGTESLPPIELDLMEILELAQLISEELGMQRGGRGTLQVRLMLNAELGAESLSHDVAFILDSNGLIPPADEELTAQKKIVSQDSEQIMQPRTFGDYLECPYFRTYGILIVVLIIFAVLTAVSERKDEYTRYASWVSRAVIPKAKEPDVYFATLKELIDTAVELDKKVIYDVRSEAYYVLDGDNWYMHKKKTD